MKFTRYTILWLCVLMACGSIDAQRLPIGHWADHFSYRKALAVGALNGEIYVACENGLFIFDPELKTSYKLSKIQGLTEVGIRSMAIDASSGSIILGYSNGNIDIIRDGHVNNIPDIKRKDFAGEKGIHQIVLSDDGFAFMACDFGVIKLNYRRNEITDAYMFGKHNSAIQVLSVHLGDSTIYAGTERGLFTAPRFSRRLNDASQWRLDSSVSQTPIPYICGFADAIWLSASGAVGSTQTSTLWKYDEQWSCLDTVATLYLGLSGGHLCHAYQAEGQDQYWVDIINTDLERVERLADDPSMVYTRFHRPFLDTKGRYWMGDERLGLVGLTGPNTVRDIVYPAGTRLNGAYSLKSTAQSIYVCLGQITSSWAPTFTQFHVDRFRDGQWTPYNAETVDSIHHFFDPLVVAEDPSDPEAFYVGTWTKGIIRLKDGERLYHYDDRNSSLQYIVINGVQYDLRVGGLAFDKKGQLWASNDMVRNALSKRDVNGQWTSYDISALTNDEVKDIMMDYYNTLWLIERTGKLFCIREAGEGIEYVIMDLNKGNDQATHRVYCTTEDLKGYIWVGTEKGIKVNYTSLQLFDDPDGLMSSQGFETIIYDGRPLLENDAVLCIAVDGSDRKWIGTQSSGVFLMSADGKEEIHHFTAANSPLISDNIQGIAVDRQTGEVFIGTDRGVMSYQSDATHAPKDAQEIRVQPNPVRPHFEGQVSISGLVNQAHVSITDASGKLVFQARAKGGTVTWDLRLPDGRRAYSGVYLIFASSADGSIKSNSKLIVLPQ